MPEPDRPVDVPGAIGFQRSLGRRRLLIAAAVVIAIAAAVTVVPMLFLEWFPSTDPTVIERRVQWLGARPIYRHLACCGPDFRRWDVVIQGVRSGDPRWLRLAVEFMSVRDAAPAEELDGAAAAAFEANPPAVVEILVPAYGAAVVCGGHHTEEHISPRRARSRLAALAAVPAPLPAVEACRSVLERIAATDHPGA